MLLVLPQVLREDSKSSILLCSVEISNHSHSGFVERILPGLVLLSKLLLELAKHLLVLLELEAGPEADHQQGGGCEELHVSLLGKTGEQGQWTESLSHNLHRTVHHSPTKQSLITFFLLPNTDIYYCSPFCMYFTLDRQAGQAKEGQNCSALHSTET